ncbi:hypothetical protein [Methanolapillus millepedarum]|uniref:DUF2971 domain-containing protein n=1 Tax=Methanolapillus millepedarum TaxID=3028296 RepID=A0AA96V2Q4_9EURY|nr:hypothetical protein MsAc7_04720 [Methanosarcinaceae archaeon Ac7]
MVKKVCVEDMALLPDTSELEDSVNETNPPKRPKPTASSKTSTKSSKPMESVKSQVPMEKHKKIKTGYESYNKPDSSFYIVHFTKSKAPFCKEKENPIRSSVKIDQKNFKSAFNRLESILKSKTIFASMMPWTKASCVCFTECPWTSLIHHAEEYSPFGIGFNKKFIFDSGGGPALYIRSDFENLTEKDKDRWPPGVFNFITPFWPNYTKQVKKLKHVDYTHEREWRVPGNLTFEYQDIEFVVVENYDCIEKIDSELKKEIGIEKFLVMDIYESIEKLWPVHNLSINNQRGEK